MGLVDLARLRRDIIEGHPVVGGDQALERLLRGGRAVELLDGVLRALRGGDEGAALEVAFSLAC